MRLTPTTINLIAPDYRPGWVEELFRSGRTSASGLRLSYPRWIAIHLRFATPPRRPGDALAWLLHLLGIFPKPGCRCASRRAWLNRLLGWG